MNWPQKPYMDWPDAQPLTEAQRQKLCEVLATAFVEIRALGWDGKHDQATALADAFHNVPVVMWTAHFSLNRLWSALDHYRTRYPGNKYADYTRLLAEVVEA